MQTHYRKISMTILILHRAPQKNVSQNVSVLMFSVKIGRFLSNSVHNIPHNAAN